MSDYEDDGGFLARDRDKGATELNSALENTAQAISAASLTSEGQQAAMTSNLAYGNTVTTTRNGWQNAIAYQQAMQKVGLAVTGKASNSVQNVAPQPARSEVKVLTSNELGAELEALMAGLAAGEGEAKAPAFSVKRVLSLVRRIVAELAKIEKRNAALKGDGTLAHPYHSMEKIFVKAPVVLGFKGVQKADLELILDDSGFRVRG